MKIRIVIFVFLGVIVSSCRGVDSSQDKDGIEKERVANGILLKVAKELKQATELRPIGTIGQMHRNVEILGLSFYYFKPIDIVEGRKLLVLGVNAMLSEINREEKIRPYLCKYPFSSQNVEIRIILRGVDGGDIAPGTLWVVVASEGMLRYKIYHPLKQGLVTIYKEKYDDAVKRIADPSLPLVPFEPDPEMTQEELTRIRKGISLVSGDGSICHLGEDGSWVQDPG